MSNTEAKFLLNAYRPSGRDASDPAFAAALAQAKSDPALGSWFAREQAHGTVIAAKLRQIAPPSDLREAILAGGRATERASSGRRQPWTTWLAMAAAIAVLAVGTYALWPARAAGEESLVAFAMNDVVHGRHGGHGVPEKAFQAELSTANTHLAAVGPVDFAQLRNSGCRTLSVAGHDVLEVCFVRDGAEFHCYIGRATDFTGPDAAVEGGTTDFVEQTGLQAAAWTKGAERFVVVGGAGLDALKRLL